MKITATANISGNINTEALVKRTDVTACATIVDKVISGAVVRANILASQASFSGKIVACATVINSGVSFCPEDRFDEQTFDVTNDTLPITTDNETNFLTVEFFNFNGDIDLTGQIPVNMRIGARVTLRKIDDTIGRILWSDGTVDYHFINTKGEYIELYWTGTKFII